LYIRESIANSGMCDGFRVAQLSREESRGESGSTVRPVRESWKTGGSGRVCFPFVSSGVMMWEEDSHGAALWLMDGYDVFVTDIYSYDRS